MFLRYLLVSAGALAVDLAVLALSVRMLPYSPALAAAIGYLTGALAHYRLSRRNVFPAGWMAGAPLAEFGAFVASGLCGLAITVGVVHVLSERVGLSVAWSKPLAVAGSFVAVYLLRVSLVFRRPPA